MHVYILCLKNYLLLAFKTKAQEKQHYNFVLSQDYQRVLITFFFLYKYFCNSQMQFINYILGFDGAACNSGELFFLEF